MLTMKSAVILCFILWLVCAAYGKGKLLRYDGVVVGVVIRRVERYDLVKIKPTESEAEH